MLKLQNSGESSEQAEVIQTMLDDANARKNELETDLRLFVFVFLFSCIHIAPDKLLFSVEKYWYFSYFSTKIYTMGIH